MVGRLFMSGIGIGTNYTWKEDAYEIELSVQVPKMTRTKDIRYKATSQSIDLRLLVQQQQQQSHNDTSTNNNTPKKEVILLDGSRQLRGRINVDGTFWVISDVPTTTMETVEQGNDELPVDTTIDQYRLVTVTIEKIIATPKDDFDIVDYDWKGIYHVEDTEEVSLRTYDAPEPFNVRQYAAEMGVDIDNLNMSMVDKTMFKSNLNITKSTLQTLHKAGYLSEQEVTQQADGTEYTINDETGEPELVTNSFSGSSSSGGTSTNTATAALLNNNNSIKKGSSSNNNSSPKKIPFVDTDSPWQNQTNTANPSTITASNATITAANADADDDDDGDDNRKEKIVQFQRNFTRAAFVADQMKNVADRENSTATNNDNNDNPFVQSSKQNNENNNNSNSNDPIDVLTVQKLKDILKSQGLKTSGTKQELQLRLRQQVNALLQGESN